MTARIFKPAKNAMQSGKAQTQEWQLDYEPEQPRVIYCERKGIAYQVIEPKEPVRRPAAYADNFAFRRGEPWTH
jgi:hypothetical protein